MTPFSPIVILNGCKNALWKKRETGWWHRVKNLWLWWHLTAFLTTVTDPSLSLQDDVLWSSSSQQQVFDIASGWRLSSVVILNGGKNAVQEKRETGQWHRVKNLWFWWHLTTFLTTVTDLPDDVWLSAYPHSYKNTVPITSDEYRILCFLSYFLTLAFRYAFGEIWEPYTSR